MSYVRIPTVQEACELNPEALSFTFADQVENLSDLLKETTASADKFFAMNHVTHGMRTLLREALRRLDGCSTQALFELRQAMGGGKTHSMLALGLLARHPEMYSKVPDDIVRGLSASSARVVAINGRAVSRNRFIWGDIAQQLNGDDALEDFWRKGPVAPNENDWMDLVGSEATLILIDELPPYLDNARTITVGGGTLADVTTHALSNLFSAAMKLPKTAIVISSLVGTYQGATRDLELAMRNLAEEAKRQAQPITPVDLSTSEIYDILRKRMFNRLPDESDIEKVARAFADEIETALRSKTIARSSEQVADEIVASYPFHPSVKALITLFRENENYRQTRGLMQFVSRMLKSVWEGSQDGEVYLIGCQHLDLSLADVRDELNRIGNLDGAISRDIESNDGSAHAQIIDANRASSAASQTATLLLTASLSQSVDAVKGLTRNTLLQYLVSPGRSAVEFGEAFDDLQRECWYLHRRDNDAWYFSRDENLRKLIRSTADTAPQGKIEEEMRRRLANAFEPQRKNAYEAVHALPKISEIQIRPAGRCCLVLSPDSRIPPEDAQKFLDTQVFKNGFCVVAGDGSSMGKLEDKVRQVWAIAKVKKSHGDNPQHTDEINELEEQYEFEVNSALTGLFNRVYYPAAATRQSAGRVSAQLAHAALKLVPGKDGINGEAAVEEALAGIGARKLVLEPESEMDALIQRAEDQLWPERQTRAPWRDIQANAQTNVRWPWLPPKGLEQVKTHAVSIGRWSDTGDGYVDKSPPKPTTGANIAQLNYDAGSGRAEIEIIAQNAGKSAEIIVSETGNFDVDGTPLVRNPLDTDASKLWFLVRDPTGQHEQGDPVVWRNQLTLTHEPKFVAGDRSVTLTVVPRGEIRWNTDGSNPKNGAVYSGEIQLTGNSEVTVYAYASDGDIEVRKEFRIPGRKEDWRLDPNSPADLVKELRADTYPEVVQLLKAAADNNALLGEPSITVGSGTGTARIRLGSSSRIKPEGVTNMIVAVRAAIEEPDAVVQASFRRFHFDKGFDLQEFARAMGENVAQSDVDQS